MAFERIKTVNGHEYKYLVESVRINGKVKQKTVKYLGRVDKEPEQFIKIPYGFWYYAQDDCSSCVKKEEVEQYLEDISRISGVKLPDMQYINLSTTKNPLPVEIRTTPMFVECAEKGIYIHRDFWDWLSWKIGRDKAINSENKLYEERGKKEKQEIKKDIVNGMKIRALKKKHSNAYLIEECRHELEKEKKCENGICVVS